MELDQLFRRPSELLPYTVDLGRRLSAYGVDAVCGPLVGGAFLAAMIATSLDCEFAFADRRVSNRPGLYPVDYQIAPAMRDGLQGKRVALVDDAISAGSALGATLIDLERCAALPVVLGALIVIGGQAQELAKSKSIPLLSLVQLENPIWAPDRCPLCNAGEPLIDPLAR